MPGMVLARGGVESHDGDAVARRSAFHVGRSHPAFVIVCHRALAAGPFRGRPMGSAGLTTEGGGRAGWRPDIADIFFRGGQAGTVPGIHPHPPRILARRAGETAACGFSAPAAAP